MPDSPYAAFHQRLAAFLIDALVGLILTLMVTFIVIRPLLLMVLQYDPSSGRIDARALWTAAEPMQKAACMLLLLIPFFADGFYCAAMESGARQSTFGKRSLGLRTIRTDGSRVSFLRAFSRYLLKLVLFLPSPFGLLAFHTWGARRQTAHDWITGVVVLRYAGASRSMAAGAGQVG